MEITRRAFLTSMLFPVGLPFLTMINWSKVGPSRQSQPILLAEPKSISFGGLRGGVVVTGRAGGRNCAVNATMRALESLRSNDYCLIKAKGILMTFTAAPSILYLDELIRASDLVHEVAHDDAAIFWATRSDNTIGSQMQVDMYVTGVDV